MCQLVYWLVVSIIPNIINYQEKHGVIGLTFYTMVMDNLLTNGCSSFCAAVRIVNEIKYLNLKQICD